jgi:hypothetical protein
MGHLGRPGRTAFSQWPARGEILSRFYAAFRYLFSMGRSLAHGYTLRTSGAFVRSPLFRRSQLFVFTGAVLMLVPLSSISYPSADSKERHYCDSNLSLRREAAQFHDDPR